MPCILFNTNVPYLIHKRPPPVYIPNQIQPVHVTITLVEDSF